MEAYYYFYSERQDSMRHHFPMQDIDGFVVEPPVNEVLIGTTWERFTEKNTSGISNFDDARLLGICPRWWIRHDGVIQDKGLRLALNDGGLVDQERNSNGIN